MKNANCRMGFATALIAVVLQPVVAEDILDGYVLSYPAADRFCPPVDGFFEEVQRTIDRVKNRTFRHQPNGGYGLPVVDTVGGANLLHLGADVAWYRVGEPVYAVADGVVRISQGENTETRGRIEVSKSTISRTPSPQPSPKGRGSKESPQPSPKARVGRKLEWGNIVVIEHRLAEGKFATTIYGHLANERLVTVGDVVHAGQQIGTIGTTRVNGGYKPHLHLGVREGRMAEVRRKLVLMTTEGKRLPLEVAEVKEKEDIIVLKGGAELPAWLEIGLGGPRFDIKRIGENAEVSAALLSYVPSADFAIAGYGLSTDGWLDPIAFLKAHGADINPAAFELAKERGR